MTRRIKVKDVPKCRATVIVVDCESRKWNSYPQEQEVEVLTVNFQRNTMRVRFTHPNYVGTGPKIDTQDISADAFFNTFSLVKRNNI